MGLRVRWKAPALACLSAVLLLLSVPKFDVQILAWVGLVPLLIALEGKTPRQAYLLAYVAGVVLFTGLSYYFWSVPAYRLIHALLLTVYLPQYVGLWGLGLAWICRRTSLPTAVVAPPLWVTLEYVRSHFGFLSLPGMLLSHSQYLHPVLLQIASFTGAYGLSFLIVLVNTAAAEAIIYARNRWRGATASTPFPGSLRLSLAAAVGLLTVATVYGTFVLSGSPEEQRLKIAVVQGNIPQNQKWDNAYRKLILDKYVSLTRDAAQAGPSLIVWPETAVPGDVRHRPELQRTVSQAAIDARAHLLVGSGEYAKFTDRKLEGRYYNSMFLFSPEGRIEGQYRKIMLLPFGEYEPLRGLIRWPAVIISPTSMGTFEPGDQYTLFNVGGVAFAAVICWETIFPDLVREFVKRGARFIVNGTNEAWFHETSASYQLLAMTVFRAAENRITIVRAANTGVSVFIDPFGRISHRLRDADGRELFVEGVLLGDLPISGGMTFYTRYGDLFAFLQIAAAALMLCYPWLTAAIRRRATSPVASWP